LGVGMFVTLLARRNAALQTVATASTIYFSLYLSAGAIITVIGVGNHISLMVYLLWFFPLRVFNKLVNAPAIGRFFAKTLLFAPVLLVLCLSPWLIVVFKSDVLMLIGIYC